MDAYTERAQEQPVRTRRKRRPVWQRMLLKYWPPVRLGLVGLNLIAFLVFLISLIFA